MPELKQKITLADLRQARLRGGKIAMLTCYDYTTARLMHSAGVPAILVGDSAANVILGHDTTLPVSLDFMIQITAAVRRGAPSALLVADMPFGSYHASLGSAVKNVCHMVQKSGCDMVKLEVADGHAGLIRRLADAGVAMMAHLGLRPQSVNLLGGYKFQGRTAREAEQIVASARIMQSAGAAALLLEAVPPQVSEAVRQAVDLPIIGCGAGPACDGAVVVVHDALGLTPRRPKFVPQLAQLSDTYVTSFQSYVRQVEEGQYPAPAHDYVMAEEEKQKLLDPPEMDRREIPF